MKNIVLTGASRAGKSTFSKMILNSFKNYEIIDGDKVIESYIENYYNESKDDDIIDLNEGYNELKKTFSQNILSNSEKRFILDYANLKNKDIFEYIKKGYLVFIFGYPKANVDYLVKNSLKYDTENDWSYYESDRRLKRIFDYYLQKSIYYENFCKDNNIVFVDVSINRNDVLKETLEYLKKINV